MSIASPDDLDRPLLPPTPIPRRPAVPPTLPTPPTRLVGRRRETEDLAALLHDGGARLVTLTGPGGVGKTRLAIAVAAAADAFRDGVAFVDLAPVADPALVASAVARSLGVRETGDRPPLDDLTAFLRPRRALLVLDNFEHLLAAAPLVSALVAACPHLALLVTSRALLRLAGEHVYPVAPLALPAAGSSAAAVAAAEAVRLFLVRARAAAPDFALTDGNVTAVAEICRRLDGLPLAIELAAARSAAFPPAALLSRLERNLPLPLVGPRDAPGRQRTLRDAIAWSFDLLSPVEQALLRRLSVFAGTFGIEAAEWVAADPVGATDADRPVGADLLRAAAFAAGDRAAASIAVRDVVAGVVSLVDQSLLRSAGEVAGEPRFRLLETIREYALAALTATGEEPTIRRRHSAYVLDLVERADPFLWQATPSPWHERLDADLDNARAALAWSLEHDAETGLRLAGGLWQFWERRDLRAEARAWLERCLARAEAASPAARARAMCAAGAIAIFQDDHARATPLLEASVAAWRALGQRVELARALLHLGETVHRQGDPQRAIALWEEALTLFREREDVRSIAEVHNLMGFAAFDLGRFDRAEALFERAISLTRETGDRGFEAQQLMNLGVVAGMRGDWARAIAMCEEALAAFRAINGKVGMGYALMNLGDCLTRVGDWTRALTLLQESLALTMEIENHEGVFFALEGLVPVALALGRPDQAARYLGAADAMRDLHGVPLTQLDVADRSERLLGPLTAILGEEGLAAAKAAGRLAPASVVVADALALAPPPRRPSPSAPVSDVLSCLTPREVEVVRLLVDGYSDKKIAASLSISRPTASKHVESIRAKLGVTSRAAVVAVAVRAGLA